MAGDGPAAENTISERLLSVSGNGRTCFDRSGSFSDLAWGAATSAYQIEGAANSGGKGPHIWDIYTAQPGHVFEQHTGEEACDHYHRYHEDVQIMKKIGLKTYGFSIGWFIVIPEGTGKVNEEGLAFYDALINELLENGIEPYITLYHWEPIYITENGMSCHDVVSLDGKVHDPNRIDFLARYLHELKRAAEEIDLRGYFQWSLMDNFEWAKGYSERFGLVYVDFRTQKRILKDSAYWYRDMIQDNGKNL